MLPVVGYVGGKRRLLPRIRPLIPMMVEHYFEPFTGMGAVYLDLRSRGFKGVAYLADTNPFVRRFWELVHDQNSFDRLLAAALNLPPAVNDQDYSAMLDRPVPVDPHTAVAVFLWLTNYAFSNLAPSSSAGHWKGAKGSKLKSALPGRTFPWSECVERLKELRLLNGQPAIVSADAEICLQHCSGRPCEVVYADPPYKNSALDYDAASVDFVTTISSARAPLVIMSEKSLVVSDGWEVMEGSVTDRVRGSAAGAKGTRTEYLFVRAI